MAPKTRRDTMAIFNLELDEEPSSGDGCGELVHLQRRSTRHSNYATVEIAEDMTVKPRRSRRKSSMTPAAPPVTQQPGKRASPRLSMLFRKFDGLKEIGLHEQAETISAPEKNEKSLLKSNVKEEITEEKLNISESKDVNKNKSDDGSNVVVNCGFDADNGKLEKRDAVEKEVSHSSVESTETTVVSVVDKESAELQQEETEENTVVKPRRSKRRSSIAAAPVKEQSEKNASSLRLSSPQGHDFQDYQATSASLTINSGDNLGEINDDKEGKVASLKKEELVRCCSVDQKAITFSIEQLETPEETTCHSEQDVTTPEDMCPKDTNTCLTARASHIPQFHPSESTVREAMESVLKAMSQKAEERKKIREESKVKAQSKTSHPTSKNALSSPMVKPKSVDIKKSTCKKKKQPSETTILPVEKVEKCPKPPQTQTALSSSSTTNSRHVPQKEMKVVSSVPHIDSAKSHHHSATNKHITNKPSIDKSANQHQKHDTTTLKQADMKVPDKHEGKVDSTATTEPKLKQLVLESVIEEQSSHHQQQAPPRPHAVRNPLMSLVSKSISRTSCPTMMSASSFMFQSEQSSSSSSAPIVSRRLTRRSLALTKTSVIKEDTSIETEITSLTSQKEEEEADTTMKTNSSQSQSFSRESSLEGNKSKKRNSSELNQVNEPKDLNNENEVNSSNTSLSTACDPKQAELKKIRHDTSDVTGDTHQQQRTGLADSSLNVAHSSAPLKRNPFARIVQKQ